MHLNASLASRLIPLAAGITLAATTACLSDQGASTNAPTPQIGVTPSTATMAIGDSVNLTVSLPPTLEPGGATFVSGNTAVVITRPNGWIIAVGRGRTNVTVTSVTDTSVSTKVAILVAG
jgi:hypothetical protein